MLPEGVAQIIKEHQLFGYDPNKHFRVVNKIHRKKIPN
jgi:hypothetical protein